jgi:uncharacterized protein (AIM24 family)
LSKITLSGNASGTGTFTIASPDSNSDRTLDLPDAAGTIQVSGNPISGTTGSFSGDLSFNSGYGSAAVAYGCRAWVNFNGTGTVAIRASGNVSSITDNGTGDYTVNFTTAMPDANYTLTGSAQSGTGGVNVSVLAASAGGAATQYNASGARIRTYAEPTTAADSNIVNVAIFR